ncbi:hypothetical protein BS17DRAFT_203491 [Gyrodon lividus]|nr:hypothetical protein BS17DRAFT_203491 [Gyrodon lividus]
MRGSQQNPQAQYTLDSERVSPYSTLCQDGEPGGKGRRCVTLKMSFTELFEAMQVASSLRMYYSSSNVEICFFSVHYPLIHLGRTSSAIKSGGHSGVNL